MQELEQVNDAPAEAPEANRDELREAVPDEKMPVSSEESEPEPSPVPTDAGPEDGVSEDEVDEILVAEAVAGPLPDEDPHTALKAIIEAAIYIADEPLTPDQIATAVEQPVGTVKEILARLADEYARPDRGLTIRELAGGYKMGTKPEHHESIRRFVRKLQAPLKLSLAALETLAVVAYKQPITAPEIMEIRGVQGAGVLKTLLDRKLIATAGRKDVIGKPIMYKTTKEFLIQFGLSSLNELPTLKEFEELGRLSLGDESPAEIQETSTPNTEIEPAEQRGDAEAGPTPEQAAPADHSEPSAESPETESDEQRHTEGDENDRS